MRKKSLQKKKKQSIKNIPMEERPLEALKEAVKEVVERHKRTGRPLAVWKNGRVVKIPASEL